MCGGRKIKSVSTKQCQLNTFGFWKAIHHWNLPNIHNRYKRQGINNKSGKMDFLTMCGCIAPALYYIIATIVALTNKSANDDPTKSANDDQTRGSSRTTKWRHGKEDRFKQEQEQEQETRRQ